MKKFNFRLFCSICVIVALSFAIVFVVLSSVLDISVLDVVAVIFVLLGAGFMIANLCHGAKQEKQREKDLFDGE